MVCRDNPHGCIDCRSQMYSILMAPHRTFSCEEYNTGRGLVLLLFALDPATSTWHRGLSQRDNNNLKQICWDNVA